MTLEYRSFSVYAFNLLCKREPYYRLETVVIDIKYNIKIIYIRFIGTHAEYDRINAKEV